MIADGSFAKLAAAPDASAAVAGLPPDRVRVVELKAISKMQPVHEAQLLSYLRLSGHQLGLLINFHVPHLKDGIKRKVNML